MVFLMTALKNADISIVLTTAEAKHITVPHWIWMLYFFLEEMKGEKSLNRLSFCLLIVSSGFTLPPLKPLGGEWEPTGLRTTLEQHMALYCYSAGTSNNKSAAGAESREMGGETKSGRMYSTGHGTVSCVWFLNELWGGSRCTGIWALIQWATVKLIGECHFRGTSSC